MSKNTFEIPTKDLYMSMIGVLGQKRTKDYIRIILEMFKDVRYTEYRKTLTLKRARRLLYDVKDHIFFYHSDTNKPTSLLFTISTSEISMILEVFKVPKTIKSHVSNTQEDSEDKEDHFFYKNSSLGHSWLDPFLNGNINCNARN